jgi:hypothetical protein
MGWNYRDCTSKRHYICHKVQITDADCNILSEKAKKTPQATILKESTDSQFMLIVSSVAVLLLFTLLVCSIFLCVCGRLCTCGDLVGCAPLQVNWKHFCSRQFITCRGGDTEDAELYKVLPTGNKKRVKGSRFQSVLPNMLPLPPIIMQTQKIKHPYDCGVLETEVSMN